jgi:dihydrodipicolinate synthase/N-acetylneuraminate lyase
MTTSSFPRPFRGIVPPIITPLLDRDTLNREGLERLIERVIAGGVHGLFILGTSGEAPSLSYRLRREVIDLTCRQVRGRVPVLVGITDTSFVESVALACVAAEAGAQAVVTSTPYYFPAGQPELLEFIERLVPELPLPLFLYNMPQMTKTQFSPEILRQMTPLDGIVGIKDSSGDLTYFDRLLEVARQRPDWGIFIGQERFLAEALRRGGHGGINAGVQIEPRLFVSLYEAAVQGDAARVATLHERILSLDRLFRVGRHASTVIKGLKCSLSLLGVCDDFMAEPFHRFREPERQRVRQILVELGLLS